MRRRIALSQNFLTNPHLVEKLLDRSSIGTNDVVYEIGPGTGTITELLASRCRQVIAVEKDHQLAHRLAQRLAQRPVQRRAQRSKAGDAGYPAGDRASSQAGVSLFHDDFLTFPLPLTPYKVFANVPFAVTAAIVNRLTAAPVSPDDSYLVVQREAALRFTGLPEGPVETLAALLLKPWFEPSIVHRFERRDFTPAPGVDVVMLRLCKR